MYIVEKNQREKRKKTFKNCTLTQGQNYRKPQEECPLLYE